MFGSSIENLKKKERKKNTYVWGKKPVGLLKIGNVPQSDDALTDETQRVERNPESVPENLN